MIYLPVRFPAKWPTYEEAAFNAGMVIAIRTSRIDLNYFSQESLASTDKVLLRESSRGYEHKIQRTRQFSEYQLNGDPGRKVP